MMLLRLVIGSVLFALSMSASAAWREARTKHFVIYSEQQPDKLRAYAERLERFDAAVRQVRGYADPPLTDGAKLTVYDLSSLAAVQELLPRNRPAVGFYLPRASGAVVFVSHKSRESLGALDSDHIIQHEYAHHLMLTDPRSPLAAWLVEGVAEFFGTAEVEADGGVRIGAPPRARAGIILRDLGFSAGDLLGGVTPRDNRDRSSIYAKGWLLTHYLAFNEARTGQLSRYLDGLSRGEPSGAAAQAAFGDLKKLDSEIDAYGRGTFPALRVAPGPTPAVQIRELSDAEEAIMPVKYRADRGILSRDIAARTAQARQIAARYPDDPEVQTVLAEVELAGRNWWKAVEAADRALAKDPNRVPAMIVRGKALLGDARGKGGNADWSQVRRYLIRANRADTENAEPLYLFYQTFQAAGQAPTADAVKGLYYAHTLAPHDLGLRFATVRQYLIDGKLPEASRTFAPIIANPHLDISRRPKLVEAMALMRSGNAPAALAAIDEDYQARLNRSDD